MTPKMQAIRQELHGKSLAVRALVAAGQFATVNEAIIEKYYRDEANKTFNTYEGWQKEGFQVKKGEKAFHVWGRPKAAMEQAEPATEDRKFFLVAFLYSNAQVVKITGETASKTAGRTVPMPPREQPQSTATN